jgi:hypothetical protein
MRFRLGMVIGFGTGYYLGAKAGRERYEQLNSLVHRATRSETFDRVTEKASEVIDLGVERASEMVDSHSGNGSSPADLPDTNPPMRP